MYVVIVAELADPNNITDVNFPDPNSDLSLDNSLLIPASYIQQRSNETGNLTPQYEYAYVTAYVLQLLDAKHIPIVNVNYANLEVILP